MLQRWVVVMEAVFTPAEFGVGSLTLLLDAVEDCSPVAMHDPGRCALQLHVEAASFTDAFVLAVDRWREGVRGLDCPDWQLVRAEVLSLEEFERDCHVAYDDIRPTASASSAFSTSSTGTEPDHRREVLASEELLRQVFEDPLTGLDTPSAFAGRLEEAAAYSAQRQTTNALLLVEVDGFQSVNDRLGHAAADELVVAMARRVTGLLTGGEKAARVGPDRVAILIEDASVHAAVALAERVLSAFGPGFHIDGALETVTATVGVAVALLRQAGGSLMGNATFALRTAKNMNRGGYYLYQADGDLEASVWNDCDHRDQPQLAASLSILREAALVVGTASTLEQAAASLLAPICAYTNWPVGHVCSVDARTGNVLATNTWYTSARARFDGLPEFRLMLPARLDSSLYRRLVASRRPEWTSDLGQELPMVAEVAADVGLCAVVVVPVLVGDELVGALQFFVDVWHEPDPSVFETLGLVGLQLGHIVGRRRAAAAPDGEDARTRGLLRGSNEILITLDADLAWHFPHPAVALPANTHMRPISFEHIVHADDRERTMAAIVGAMSSPGEHPTFECRVQSSDGAWRWMRFTPRNLFADPAVAGLVLTGRHIAEQSHGRATLRSGHQRRPAVGAMRIASGSSNGPSRGACGRFRYELFGWDPTEPAPSLDEFLSGPEPETVVGQGLQHALTHAHADLQAAVQARATKNDGPD